MNKSRQHTPKKRFGQNFLEDSTVCHAIIEAIRPEKGEHLIEIGPGLGALTKGILTRTHTLTAIELDYNLIAQLKKECLALGSLTLYEEDALKFDFLSYAQAPNSLRVFGNLPYNISTPFLFHLLNQIDSIFDMHFMLQKEVVQRLAAKPNTKDYGRLSVMIQSACTVEDLFFVDRSAFSPEPKVDSAVVRLLPRSKKLPLADPMTFAAIVRDAFSQRRKTLRNSLKQRCNNENFEAIGIDPSLRAENLSVEDFVLLSNTLSNL